MLARDKHSSLLQKFINYGQKSFITLAPGHLDFIGELNTGGIQEGIEVDLDLGTNVSKISH
jgi:hypothetical protein